MFASIIRPQLRFVAVLAVTLSTFVGSAIGAKVAHAQSTANVETHPFFGEKAPAFRLATVAGDTVSLDRLRGEYLVVHFAASW